jgi:hypothetical protein
VLPKQRPTAARPVTVGAGEAPAPKILSKFTMVNEAKKGSGEGSREPKPSDMRPAMFTCRPHIDSLKAKTRILGPRSAFGVSHVAFLTYLFSKLRTYAHAIHRIAVLYSYYPDSPRRPDPCWVISRFIPSASERNETKSVIFPIIWVLFGNWLSRRTRERLCLDPTWIGSARRIWTNCTRSVIF